MNRTIAGESTGYRPASSPSAGDATSVSPKSSFISSVRTYAATWLLTLPRDLHVHAGGGSGVRADLIPESIQIEIQ